MDENHLCAMFVYRRTTSFFHPLFVIFPLFSRYFSVIPPLSLRYPSYSAWDI